MASSYTNLAGLLRGQNRTEEALAFTQKALAIRIRALPSNHPDLAAVHLSLANLLRDLGQCAPAACHLLPPQLPPWRHASHTACLQCEYS